MGYLGLPTHFVAGEIVLGDRPEECPEGVTVRLRHGLQTVMASTDNFGDFEFNGLEVGAEYDLSIEHAGYEPCELHVDSGADPNVGTIVMKRAV